MKRQEFEVLDALRGVASLSVGALHVNGLILRGGFDCLTYLAVDFFFCLSGFVLSYAYGARLAAGVLPQGAFFTLRLRRLYPMILAGAVLALLVGLAVRTSPLAETLTLGLATLALLPAGFLFGDIAFPLNNVLWSLVFEIGAGVLLASLAASRDRVWGLIAVVSGALLVMAAWHGADPGQLGFGTPLLFLFGVPRMLLPFALGILVERAFARGHKAPAVSPWLPMLLLVIVLFSIPASLRFAAVLSTALAVPLIVWLGASAPAGPSAAPMRHLGAVSYPFYAVHLPIVIACGRIADGAGLPPGSARWALSGAAIAAAWLLAWWLERHWDRPVRAWLTARAATGVPVSA